MGIDKNYAFVFNGNSTDIDHLLDFIKDAKVEGVCFDLGGTVVDLRPEVKEKMAKYINSKWKCHIDQELLNQAFAHEWAFRRENQDDQEKVKHVVGEKGEKEYWINFYLSILRRLGLENVERSAVGYLAKLQSDPTSFDVFQFVSDLLTRLEERRTKIGIISNGFDSARKILHDKKLIKKFDVIVLSCDPEINSIKPEPEIYQKAVTQMGMEPGKILFIDDYKPFVDAAIQCGMQGALITHKIASANENNQKIDKGRSAERNSFTSVRTYNIVRSCLSWSVGF